MDRTRLRILARGRKCLEESIKRPRCGYKGSSWMVSGKTACVRYWARSKSKYTNCDIVSSAYCTPTSEPASIIIAPGLISRL